MRARLQEPVSPLAVPANRLRGASGGSIFEKSKPARGGWAAAAALLPDGRLHLQQGPIDIVAEAFGPTDAVTAAYDRAAQRFETVLEELVAELPALRSEGQALQGEIARAMAAAVAPYRPAFITPMAAVAGAVADAVVAALAGPGIDRAYANNGGDIAMWLTTGMALTTALAVTGGLDRVTVQAKDGVSGIATSGWRGRSFSLGIADAVTVLAPTAAMADAAATMIANAVDLPGHDGIRRRPARDCQADSDLGDRLVTVAVAPLTASDRACALDRGLAAAEAYRARELIAGAALYLQGETRLTGVM
ncbi:MAG: hypothetical protein EAZ40_12125, partial [Rhodobacterales bacterium]